MSESGKSKSKGRGVRLGSTRDLREAAKNRWPSVGVQEARHEAEQVVLELTCNGSRLAPHDEDVLITAGRDLRTGILYLRRGGVEWESRPGEDGFLYGTDYPSKTNPRCKHCPNSPRISGATLKKCIDEMVRAGCRKLRTDYRELEGRRRNVLRLPGTTA